MERIDEPSGTPHTRKFPLRPPAIALAVALVWMNFSGTIYSATNMKRSTVDSTIEQKSFGMVEGHELVQYTLRNASGMVVRILNFGGIVTGIEVPDRKGGKGDVVLGFDNPADYIHTANPYFGCLVGRYANRIAKATFTLDGVAYHLGANDGANTLHGGFKGFNKHFWTAIPQPQRNALALAYDSKDGEEGYPGNLHAEVEYRLTPDNQLVIEYSATSDKPTPVNLTNHSYFNLSGGKDSTILNHIVTLAAAAFTPVDAHLIPTGKIQSVSGTPMDFQDPKPIGRDIASVQGGYDHNWVLKSPGKTPALAATVYDPASGRLMEVFTTEPGIQFYTGNFLDGSIHGKSSRSYVKNGGLCLEAQHFPDSPNQPEFPSTILRPGATYHQITVYKFSVRHQ